MPKRALRGGLYLVLATLLVIAISWIISAPRKALLGTWQSDGYGLYFDVGRTVIDVYQVTDISCHRDMRIPAHLGAVRLLEGATFEIEDARLKLAVTGSLNPIYADRTNGLPPQCHAARSPDSYNVFWQAMSEHYAFFDLHGVDWNTRKSPTSDNTWDAIVAAMSDLDDGHLYIYDGTRAHSPSIPPTWYEDRQVMRDAARNSLRDGPIQVANSGLAYGAVSDHIGYISIEHMDVDVPFGKRSDQMATQAFAEIARNLSRAEALIIDVRHNPGGSDDVALAYASFFTRAPVPAFSKTTRTQTGYTDPTFVTTQPGPTDLAQPVFLLTSELTGSAAEIFTLAMRELPQVTTMGTKTGGGLSDGLNFTLPNGWELGLSHQVYLTPNGELFEGIGIRPDIVLPVDVATYRAGNDPLIAAAIAQYEASR